MATKKFTSADIDLKEFDAIAELLTDTAQEMVESPSFSLYENLVKIGQLDIIKFTFAASAILMEFAKRVDMESLLVPSLFAEEYYPDYIKEITQAVGRGDTYWIKSNYSNNPSGLVITFMVAIATLINTGKTAADNS